MFIELLVFMIAIVLAESIYRYGLSKLRFLSTKSEKYQKRFKSITIGVMFVSFMFVAIVLEII
ncbi:hypothetical protein [Ureibacillus acetophenoni]|uniref:Uncharacterized protein n=1 Tax=Ureibacillus acetophenoni TaxID=614649 RepID=A0A285UHX0_9BACL|nr:hypothetical protein [Ureibacillus acetophenoni]SOC41480.1 hypothetical protein SAMN05877842_11091 [Ureibacillus acetophenoni]